MIGVERRAGRARIFSDIEQRHPPVGAGYNEIAVGEIDVGLRRLKHLGSHTRAFGDDFIGSAKDRGTAHIGRARAAMPAAMRNKIGVALLQED